MFDTPELIGLGAILSLFSLVLGFYIWITMQNLSVYDQVYHDYAAAKASTDAQQIFRDECASLSVVEEVISCFENSAKSAREVQRSEEDLYAQKEMAEWAKWMLFTTTFVGFMSIVISIAGTLLVTKTLRLQSDATKQAARATNAAIKANEIAEDNYLADQRPWVLVEADIVGNVGIDAQIVIMPMRVGVRNLGKTPAINARFQVQPIHYGLSQNINDKARAICQAFRGKHTGTGDILGQDGREVNRESIIAIPADRVSVKEKDGALTGPIYIVAFAVYQSILDPTRIFETCVLYEVIVEMDGRRTKSVRFESAKVRPDKVALNRIDGGYVT